MWEMDIIVIITIIHMRFQTIRSAVWSERNTERSKPKQYGQNMYGNGANQQYGQNMYGNGAISSMARTCTEMAQISSTARTCTETRQTSSMGQNPYGTAQGDAQIPYGTSQQQSWNDEYNNKDYE